MSRRCLGRVLSCFDFRHRPARRDDRPRVSVDRRSSCARSALRRGAGLRADRVTGSRSTSSRSRTQSTSARSSCACRTRRSRPARSRTSRRSCGARAKSARSSRSTPISRSARCRSTSTQLDVDFVLGGAHKWLCGSYESAFLYVRPALLPRARAGGDRLDRLAGSAVVRAADAAGPSERAASRAARRPCCPR